MLLVLGFPMPIIKRPQQGVEEARLDMGKKGAESENPQDRPARCCYNANGRLPIMHYGEL